MHTTDEDDGRETLPEVIQEALGNCILRSRERHPNNSGMIEAAFQDLRSLNQAKLFHLVGPQLHGSGVKSHLTQPTLIQEQYGRMLWSDDLLAQDIEVERLGRLLPRSSNSPRLFIAHSWGDNEDEDLMTDEFAGWLFNQGYDIVYDRDPRHISKGFSSDEILLLLFGCSQMVVIVTDSYQQRILDSKRTSPVCQEFSLAQQSTLAKKPPTLLGLWLGGEELVPPFSASWVVDCRDAAVFDEKKERWFPARQFEVVCLTPDKTEFPIGPISRLAVRPLVDKLLSEVPGCKVLVRDITNKTLARQSD